MCKSFLPVYNSAKIIKIHKDFPELWSHMFCHLFMVHSVVVCVIIGGHWRATRCILLTVTLLRCVAVSCMTRCNWLQCCRNALQKHALLCIIALCCVYHWLHICCSYVPVAGNEHRGLLFLLFLFLTFREIVSSQLFWYFCCFFLGFQNDSYRVYSYAFFILLYMSNYDFLSPQKPLLQLESIEKCCVCHQVTYKSCLPLV